MTIIAPSILAADLTILEDQVKTAEQAGAQWFHLDVMDGHFVPNISFGPMMVEAMRKITSKPLDVHLMINRPDEYVPSFVDAGADLITIHAEVSQHLHRSIELIHSYGIKAGVAINPATPVGSIELILPDVELILCMTVNPGFGGQKFIPSSISKIRALADLISTTGRKIHLEVDGGMDSSTAPSAVDAGADVIVAGSAVFQAPNIGQAVGQILQSCTRGQLV